MAADPTLVSESTSGKLVHFPVTFFAVIMGLAGLTLATHRFALSFGISAAVGLEYILTAITILTFLAVCAVYLFKGIRHPHAVVAEWNHPVRIAFFPAITIGGLLIAATLLPLSRTTAHVLWIISATAHLAVTLGVVAAWISARPFEQAHLTPAWFIPAVGNVLVPIAGARLGYMEVSWFFFSVGMLFWLVFLTLVFNRLIFHNPIAERLLPTLVILIAPPSAGFIAWLQINGGDVDTVARLLYYSALMFVLVTLTQIRKLVKLPFAMSWWAYSFPVAAFTIASGLFAAATGALFQQAVMLVAYLVLWSIIIVLIAKTVGAMRRDEICRPDG